MILIKARIEVEYITKSKKKFILESEEIYHKDLLILINDLLNSGRVKNITITDSEGTTWTKKELEKLTKEIEVEPHDIICYFDGGYEKDTKMSGLGIVIYFSKDNKNYRIRKNKSIEGLISNNESEFAALHYVLQVLEEMNVTGQEIKVFGDSNVVVNQFFDIEPTFEKEHLFWLGKIDEILENNKLRINLEQIDRRKNEEAHNLATQALKNILIESEIQI
ncbi:MAG: hypothetical protein K0S51_1723 [Bacillales bacterium]|nr:hypothetical protein [Bacillales bacterium]